jgi:FKBP-type peptidyl-prolyl cis-trans isomerase 2
MTGENNAKKDRDPIFMVCLGIFAIAAIIAVGCFIVNEYFPSSDAMASDGDTVSVNYTGTYYAYYGEENAVVFDTSYSGIANDDNVAKSNDFTKKSSYSPLEFTVGKGTMLAGFEDSVIGHKVGDKYKIYLSATEGYLGASTEGKLSTTDNVMNSTETMPKSQFTSIYSDVTISNSQMVKFESKYTWDAYVMGTDNGNSVIISYMPTVGSSYTVYESGDTTVTYKVTSVSDGKIHYDIDIKNPKYVNGSEIQMIKINLGEETIYITNISGSDITYKTGSERINEPLYFEIEIVSIS